jgi:hypothetical protein
MKELPNLEIRVVIEYEEDVDTPENAVLGEVVSSGEEAPDGEVAVCAVVDGEPVALGTFASGTQSDACRDVLLKLFEPGLFGDLVLTLPGFFIFKMSHIGDISHISNLISQVLQVPVNHIERNSCPCMAQMGIPVNRRPANIHPHKWRFNRLKLLFFP